MASWEGSYTAMFDPDYSIAITVTKGATVQKHWLHFDAKCPASWKLKRPRPRPIASPTMT
jgi:hypothetical protein